MSSRLNSRRLLMWWGLALLIIALDQFTKLWVLAVFSPGERVPVTPFFDLVLLFNPGAAFSFLADHSGWQRWFFTGLALLVCTWLGWLLAQHRHEVLQPLSFALIIGGAIGNVIDRLWIGAVVDFLYFHAGGYGWPAFNVADSAISVGVALMIWAQFRPPTGNPAHE